MDIALISQHERLGNQIFDLLQESKLQLKINRYSNHYLGPTDIAIQISNEDHDPELTRSLRTCNNFPIIVVGPGIPPVLGQNHIAAGANHFIRRETELQQLIVLLRKYEIEEIHNPKREIDRFKDLELDHQFRTIRRQSSAIKLSRQEFTLLSYLIKNPNRILTKKHILATVWPDPEELKSKTLESHICKLRKKIDDDYPEKRIHTISHSGYMLN